MIIRGTEGVTGDLSRAGWGSHDGSWLLGVKTNEFVTCFSVAYFLLLNAKLVFELNYLSLDTIFHLVDMSTFWWGQSSSIEYACLPLAWVFRIFVETKFKLLIEFFSWCSRLTERLVMLGKNLWQFNLIRVSSQLATHQLATQQDNQWQLMWLQKLWGPLMCFPREIQQMA